MATTGWLNTIKEAKKTTLVQDGRTKVHYSFPDGREMAEQYDNNSGIIIERKWKEVPVLGGEGRWTFEIGQEPEKPDTDIRESSSSWRIRNLPYPSETYQLSIEDNVIVLRTTNKKYYKRFTIPDLDRIGVRLDPALLSKIYKNNTLVISYAKPSSYLAFEKELKAELSKTKPISGGDVPCASM
ncbi:hypothetical protein Aperf_G00000099681 [Anoplocephala perfoliata]